MTAAELRNQAGLRPWLAVTQREFYQGRRYERTLCLVPLKNRLSVARARWDATAIAMTGSNVRLSVVMRSGYSAPKRWRRIASGPGLRERFGW